MLEHAIPDARAPARHGGELPHGEDVGCLLLGENRFRVVLASALSPLRRNEDVCLFEINGLQLAVLVRHEAGHADTEAEQIAARLTGRELQIAVLVAQGCATKNIAYRLQISEWTVATYLRRIFAKLNVDSRAAMVYRCASLINATLKTDVGLARKMGNGGTNAWRSS